MHVATVTHTNTHTRSFREGNRTLGRSKLHTVKVRITGQLRSHNSFFSKNVDELSIGDESKNVIFLFFFFFLPKGKQKCKSLFCAVWLYWSCCLRAVNIQFQPTGNQRFKNQNRSIVFQSHPRPPPTENPSLLRSKGCSTGYEKLEVCVWGGVTLWQKLTKFQASEPLN